MVGELEAFLRCERGKSLGGVGRVAANRGGELLAPTGRCLARMQYNTNCLPLISGLTCPLAAPSPFGIQNPFTSAN